jgi:YlmC/YmxH family sporulation protein
MRFSELASKEIINLSNGSRLGPLGDTDLEIDPKNGEIHTILVPPRGRFGRQVHQPTVIPWTSIRRIGPEVMIVDLDDDQLRRQGSEN